MSEPILDFEALEAMTSPAEVKALEGPLEKLEGETDILLFIAPGCTACPHQIRAVATLTLASPKIAVEIVDATQEPEFAAQYGVRSVPTTVVNDELIMVGVIPAPELALRVLAQQGPDSDKVVFASLVESGRFSDAAAHIWDGHGVEAFGELWSRSSMEQRMNLFLVAEEALAADEECMDGLLPLLIAGLEGEGPLTQDPSRKGDTADLLGRIGHPDARPALERLAKDSNPEVAEAAEEALAEMGHLDA
ncbi:MAG: thioredoxin family protein [Longimicrobiales bacterium]